MTTEEQREEHTARTIEAVGILKGAFEEIERLNLKIEELNFRANGLELENQELRNTALMSRSLSNGVNTPTNN